MTNLLCVVCWLSNSFLLLCFFTIIKIIQNQNKPLRGLVLVTNKISLFYLTKVFCVVVWHYIFCKLQNCVLLLISLLYRGFFFYLKILLIVLETAPEPLVAVSVKLSVLRTWYTEKIIFQVFVCPLTGVRRLTAILPCCPLPNL